MFLDAWQHKIRPVLVRKVAFHYKDTSNYDWLSRAIMHGKKWRSIYYSIEDDYESGRVKFVNDCVKKYRLKYKLDEI